MRRFTVSSNRDPMASFDVMMDTLKFEIKIYTYEFDIKLWIFDLLWRYIGTSLRKSLII